MADFTSNAPLTVTNPYTPASVIEFAANSLQSDATGVFPTGFAFGTFAHNVNYGSTITATLKLAAVLSADEILVGGVVRLGANAGCFVGIRFNGSTDAVIVTATAAGSYTSISTSSTITALAVNDVLSTTLTNSSGTLTIGGNVNGTNITFSGNTTTTFGSESSLAAGWGFDPQDNNKSKYLQITGTGVAGGGGGHSNQGLLSLGVAISPLAWIIGRRNKLALERRFEQDQKSRIFLPTYRKSR